MKYEIKTFADDEKQRVMYVRVPHRTEPAPDGIVYPEPLPPTQYIGAASWQPNPQQQVNFQFKIEAESVDEAFANWEAAHEPAERESRRIYTEQQRQALLMSAAQPDPTRAAQAILSGRRVR